MASNLTNLTKRKVFRWKADDDLELLKLVVAHRPRATQAWETIAKICSEKMAEPRGCVLTNRGCLDRYKLLVNAHRTDTNKALAR